MTERTATRWREFHIGAFMDLFISALVLRGKRYIYRRREAAGEERRRMHAVSEYLSELVEAADRKDRDRLYFIVRLRNELSPGNIGSFDNFYGAFAQKQLTIVSIDFPIGDYYKLELQAITAKCYLDQADPRFKELAEKCADVYMSELEKR